jgi:N-acetylmuramoyl-L-alanine amidase
MTKKVCSVLLFFLAFAVAATAADKRFTLVIDAGHGGKDTGAPGIISKEKNINLSVALTFGKYVEQNCPDVRVIYTRKNDTFISLKERANIANDSKADLFVSIHTNALDNGAISRGFETYTLGDGRSHATKTNLEVAKRENSVILFENDYKRTYKGFDPNSSESNIMFELIQGQNMERSIKLAKMIQKNVCSSASRIDKGVHQDNFLVLRETSMPSCLVELGFITTPDEEQELNSENVVDNISRGLYNAFISYKSKYDNKLVVPYKSLPVAKAEIPQIVPDKEDSITEDSKIEKKADKKSEKTKIIKDNDQAQPEETKQESPKDNDITSSSSQPVFKIQILASDRKLSNGDKALKGLEDCETFEENDFHKYTYGASTDYNEIYNLRKKIIDKFPQAFIIAFKDGKKVNVVDAIKEFKSSKRKK